MKHVMRELNDLLFNGRGIRGWSFGDFARALGATNVSKMASRLARLERNEAWDLELFLNATAVLGIERSVVDQMLSDAEERRRAEFEEWVSVPVPPELYYSPLAGFWLRRPIPEEVTTIEALLEHARGMSRGDCAKSSVALNRRITVWFAGGRETSRTEARPGGVNVPYMTVGGSAPFIMETTR